MTYYVKKEKTSCERSCKGRIVNKEKGIYCDHIEKKLPKPARKYGPPSIKVSMIEMFASPTKEEFVPIEEIEWKLRKFGLDQYETELVISRVIEGKKMKTIVQEQGWTNINSANYYLRKTLKKLREGGFRLR